MLFLLGFFYLYFISNGNPCNNLQVMCLEHSLFQRFSTPSQHPWSNHMYTNQKLKENEL